MAAERRPHITEVRPQPPPGEDERSLGELLSDLARDTGTLVRQEVQLAKTELSEKAKAIGKAVASLAAGAAVAYAGFLTLLAALVLGLAYFIPAWVAAGVVGLVVAAAGYFMVQKGMNDLKQTDLTPQQTVDTLKEDAEWAKAQVR